MGAEIAVRVDVVVMTLTGEPRGLHLLVDPSRPHRLPGAALAAEEDLSQAAQRVLDDIGVGQPRHLEQLASFGAPGRQRGRRTVSVTYLALLPEPRAGAAGVWVDVADLPHLAWDHDEITAAAVQRVRSKLSYSTIAFGLLADEFTMSELQEVYEAVLATTLDKRNFRKKVHALGLVTETGGLRRGQHRPAQLYRFRSNGLVLLDDVIATA